MEDYGYPTNRKCLDCGWSGNDGELWCSLEDSDRPAEDTSEIDFNLCPECKSDRIVNV